METKTLSDVEAPETSLPRIDSKNMTNEEKIWEFGNDNITLLYLINKYPKENYILNCY